MSKPKLIRITTVPISLEKLLEGQLAFLNEHFYVVAISGGGPSLEIVREREKVEIIEVKMERKIHLLKDLISFINLIKILREEGPTIVHSITPKAGLLSMLAAKITGVPIRIHTFTGLIFPSKNGVMKKLLIKMDKILCWAATDIYPEGNGVKQELINYNITKKSLKVLANGNVNGIDTEYFNPKNFGSTRSILRQDLKIADNSFVFVFVGRLVGDKGINELVTAFNTLNSEFRIQNSKLLLVGPLEAGLDPLKPETLQAIESIPNIISVGYQADVRPYFAAADALVFPSYREGFPNVVMQAGAMGLPSIVTDINGCNEIIIHRVNGLIIPPKNSETLVEAMRLLMEDINLYQQLQGNARAQITNRFEQQQVWDALFEEYQSLLKQKSRK
jgi:glycosyltransferase involved in cell wall biosynthesis